MPAGSAIVTTTTAAAVEAISAATVAALGKPINVTVVPVTAGEEGFVSVDAGTVWLPFGGGAGGVTTYNHIAVTGAVQIKRAAAANISCYVGIW